VSLVTPFSEQGLEGRPGQYIYSTSEQAFTMHTDGTGFRKPFDLILLHCFRADTGDEQGLSLLVSVDELVTRLSAEDIKILLQPNFPFNFGLGPILKQNQSGQFSIQYNPEELQYFYKSSGIQLAVEQTKALQKLNELLQLSAVKIRFVLRAGECLIVNNHRLLHGRTALSKGSKRLLKRVRLFWKEEN
jgi:hypothetical protein